MGDGDASGVGEGDGNGGVDGSGVGGGELGGVGTVTGPLEVHAELPARAVVPVGQGVQPALPSPLYVSAGQAVQLTGTTPPSE